VASKTARTFFNVFIFFSKFRKHDFLRFLSCARFLEHWLPLLLLLCGIFICRSKRFSSSMICGVHKEFGKDWTLSSVDMLADRQIHTETDIRIAIPRSPTEGGVKACPRHKY